MIVALYLRSIGRRSLAYAAPAVVVLAITFTAMGIQVVRDLGAGSWMVGGVGALIAVLTLWVALEALGAWRQPAAQGEA